MSFPDYGAPMGGPSADSIIVLKVRGVANAPTPSRVPTGRPRARKDYGVALPVSPRRRRKPTAAASPRYRFRVQVDPSSDGAGVARGSSRGGEGEGALASTIRAPRPAAASSSSSSPRVGPRPNTPSLLSRNDSFRALLRGPVIAPPRRAGIAAAAAAAAGSPGAPRQVNKEPEEAPLHFSRRSARREQRAAERARAFFPMSRAVYVQETYKKLARPSWSTRPASGYKARARFDVLDETLAEKDVELMRMAGRMEARRMQRALRGRRGDDFFNSSVSGRAYDQNWWLNVAREQREREAADEAEGSDDPQLFDIVDDDDGGSNASEEVRRPDTTDGGAGAGGDGAADSLPDEAALSDRRSSAASSAAAAVSSLSGGGASSGRDSSEPLIREESFATTAPSRATGRTRSRAADGRASRATASGAGARAAASAAAAAGASPRGKATAYPTASSRPRGRRRGIDDINSGLQYASTTRPLLRSLNHSWAQDAIVTWRRQRRCEQEAAAVKSRARVFHLAKPSADAPGKASAGGFATGARGADDDEDDADEAAGDNRKAGVREHEHGFAKYDRVSDIHGFLCQQDINELTRNTNYNRRELFVMYCRFKALCGLSPRPDGIDKDTFKNGVARLAVEDRKFVDRVFRLVDEDDSGEIEWPEFVQAMSALEKGSVETTCRFFFQVYDLDCDGYISRDDLAQMFHSAAMLDNDTTTQEVVDTFVNRTMKLFEATESGRISLDDVIDYMKHKAPQQMDVWEVFGRSMLRDFGRRE